MTFQEATKQTMERSGATKKQKRVKIPITFDQRMKTNANSHKISESDKFEKDAQQSLLMIKTKIWSRLRQIAVMKRELAEIRSERARRNAMSEKRQAQRREYAEIYQKELLKQLMPGVEIPHFWEKDFSFRQKYIQKFLTASPEPADSPLRSPLMNSTPVRTSDEEGYHSGDFEERMRSQLQYFEPMERELNTTEEDETASEEEMTMSQYSFDELEDDEMSATNQSEFSNSRTISVIDPGQFSMYLENEMIEDESNESNDMESNEY